MSTRGSPSIVFINNKRVTISKKAKIIKVRIKLRTLFLSSIESLSFKKRIIAKKKREKLKNCQSPFKI